MTHEDSLARSLEWDSYTWSRSVRYWLSSYTAPSHGGRILEVGSGSGRLSRWFQLQGYEVVGSDVDWNRVSRAVDCGFPYLACSMLQLPIVSSTIDIVVVRSVLGSVRAVTGPDGLQQAFDEVGRVLKPGGALFYAENIRGSRLHMMARRNFTEWGKRWFYFEPGVLKSYVGWSSEVHSRLFGGLSLFGPNEAIRRGLGRVDRLYDRHVQTSSWSHVEAGVVVKL